MGCNCGENGEEFSKFKGIVSITWCQGHPMQDSLPIYVMFLFPIPTKVVNKLDKYRRDLCG